MPSANNVESASAHQQTHSCNFSSDRVYGWGCGHVGKARLYTAAQLRICDTVQIVTVTYTSGTVKAATMQCNAFQSC